MLNFDDRKDEAPAEVKQIELFRLNGKTYSVPEKISAGKVLAFMQEMRVSGKEGAAVGLLIDTIGQAGYQKLVSYPGLTTADLKAIFETVAQVAMGSMEEMTGN